MPSLTALAEEILSQAKELDRILEQNDLPYTSFEKDTLESLPSDAQKLRWSLVDNSHSFRLLVRGAQFAGVDIAFSWTEQLVLRIVCRYKIASAVPLDGSATYDEIAAATGLSTSSVRRTIRAACLLGMFDEVEPGHVSHTALSRLLAEDEGFYNAMGLQLEDIGPASLKFIDAWEQFGDDGDPTQSAFSLANGGRSMFDVFAEEPERAHRFDKAMKWFMETKGLNFDSAIAAFDWPTLDQPGSRLVDVGGGYGQVAQGLAKETKHLKFVVQDLPHVAEKGRELLAPELKDRISFEGQSFMEPQPSDNPPSAFLISRCLHNWSDRHCITILRALIPAMRKDSKLLIWDTVLAEHPMKKLSERFDAQQDLVMATIAAGRDRTAEEFRQLLLQSDPRFVITSIRRPEGSQLSMVEVTWSDNDANPSLSDPK